MGDNNAALLGLETFATFWVVEHVAKGSQRLDWHLDCYYTKMDGDLIIEGWISENEEDARFGRIGKGWSFIQIHSNNANIKMFAKYKSIHSY